MSDERKTVTMPIEEYRELKEAYRANFEKAEKERKETDAKLNKGLMKIVDQSHGFGLYPRAIVSWSDGAKEYEKLYDENQVVKERIDKVVEEINKAKKMSYFQFLKWKKS